MQNLLHCQERNENKVHQYIIWFFRRY